MVEGQFDSYCVEPVHSAHDRAAALVRALRASRAEVQRSRVLTEDQIAATAVFLEANDALPAGSESDRVSYRVAHKWLRDNYGLTMGRDAYLAAVCTHFGRQSWSKK